MQLLFDAYVVKRSRYTVCDNEKYDFFSTSYTTWTVLGVTTNFQIVLPPAHDARPFRELVFRVAVGRRHGKLCDIIVGFNHKSTVIIAVVVAANAIRL